MCLLVFAWHVDPAAPLVVAANRDERLDRSARSICVLRRRKPRILGGRDELAGGTWLAVNEHGVVAGLTNRPSPGGRDMTKRSRGELPLIAAGQRCADDGVDDLLSRVRPGVYNAAWLLVGDRRALHYVEVPDDRPPVARRLAPGIHVLENTALDSPSVKAGRIFDLVTGAVEASRLWVALPSILAGHTTPATVPDPVPLPRAGAAVPRPQATLAACVHADGYGTRSAALVRVGTGSAGPPCVLVADGAPCSTPFADVGQRWHPDRRGPPA